MSTSPRRNSICEVYFLVQSCRNCPVEFARCPRCPPVACQRRLLPLPVFVTLIFGCFLVQVVNFIFTVFASLSVYRLSCTTDFTRSYASFFFAEKKKRSKKRKEFAFHLYCKIPISPEDYTRNCHHRFSPTKLPRRGKQAAAAAVTLPFLQLKLGRRVSGDSPQSPGGAYRRLLPP